jgi:uncharacterized membrane protein YkoI
LFCFNPINYNWTFLIMPNSLRLTQRLALVMLAGLLAAAGAQAQSGGRPTGRNHNDAPSRSFAGPDRAANAAREATGGRVLGVQGADHNGQRGYRVRILEPGGRVRSLHIDPESGAVRD